MAVLAELWLGRLIPRWVFFSWLGFLGWVCCFVRFSGGLGVLFSLAVVNTQVVFSWKILDEKHSPLLAGSDSGYGNAHPNASRKGCDLPW